MLKFKKNKKRPSTSISKSSFPETKIENRPEWNSNIGDPDKYKLSQAELIQRKVSLMSKHKTEAKELWQKRQEKLQNGIIDDETRTVLETCLSCKRAPEKNTKNITYFIKNTIETDKNYTSNRQLERSPTDDRLTLEELRADERPKPVRRVRSNSRDGDKDFMKKIEENIKDARDFIDKIERYPSARTNEPDKALRVIVTMETEKIVKKSAPMKETRTGLPKRAPSRSEKESSGTRESEEAEDSLKISAGPSKETIPDCSHIEKNHTVAVTEGLDEDISKFFPPLNKIEDTIKFLEENLLAYERQTEPLETKPAPKEEPAFVEAPKKNPLEEMGFKSLLSTRPREEFREHFPEALLNESPKTVKRDMEKSMRHGSGKNMTSNLEDEQISFSLTNRSNADDNEKGFSELLFGPSDRKYEDLDFDIPEQPRVYSQPRPVEKEPSMLSPEIKPTQLHFNPPKPQTNGFTSPPSAVDEDELNIERIKRLLESTRTDIERMNVSSSISPLNAKELEEPAPVPKPQGYQTVKVPIFNPNKENPALIKMKENINIGNTVARCFDIQNNSNLPGVRKTTVLDELKDEKNPMDLLMENQRRILDEITNHRVEEEIPLPKPFMKPTNYTPKYQGDSLSIRSFIRK